MSSLQQHVWQGCRRVMEIYHGHEIRGDLSTPAEPTLFVGNHGFGGVFDLNVAAALATFAALELDRPVTVLGHQLIWTLGLGRIFEAGGVRPAGGDSAAAALRRGEHVFVLPGGDIDAFKDFQHRNEIVFAERTGFARLALEQEVPLRPIVTEGAGLTALSLSDGQRMAAFLRLHELTRVKALPVSITVPWGFSVGLGGLLPYVPLPATITTEVLPEIRPNPADDDEALAMRVRQAMQAALTRLAEDVTD